MSEEGLIAAYERYKADSDAPAQLRRRASAPLLVKPTKEWFSSTERLLIVGQETNGWSSTDQTLSTLYQFHEQADSVNTMLAAYSDFDFAATYRHRNSAFWRAFRILTSGRAALWTNLFRTDVEGPVFQNCCASEIRQLLRSQGSLLRDEIRELAPTIVLFLTGPRYDPALLEVFGDAKLKPFWADVPERETAFVESSGLPSLAVRTYHPSYLQRSRRWSSLIRLSEFLERSRTEL